MASLRPLLRMERAIDGIGAESPPGIRIDSYDVAAHHAIVPQLYAAAFARPPWSADWDGFDEFDPAGVFLARSGKVEIGFVISFRRRDHGYISVVAVSPGFRRRGVASGLVKRAAGYLHSLGLENVRIDAWEDSPAAVRTYMHLGFQVFERKMAADDSA